MAARAGVRQSHVTYYFPMRNDLLRATAQFGVETLLDPIASIGVAGEPSHLAFRQLLMPDKSDRKWFRLMTGLLIASDEDESIRPWLRQFEERILEKLGAGFSAVGIAITRDQLHFLYATFVGALHLDMQAQTDESFARVERTVAMALDMVLPAPAVQHMPENDETSLPLVLSSPLTHNLNERPLHTSHVKTV